MTFELFSVTSAVSFTGTIESRHVIPSSQALVHRAIECEISGTRGSVKANTVEVSVFVGGAGDPRQPPVALCQNAYLDATVAVRCVFRHSVVASFFVVVISVNKLRIPEM